MQTHACAPEWRLFPSGREAAWRREEGLARAELSPTGAEQPCPERQLSVPRGDGYGGAPGQILPAFWVHVLTVMYYFRGVETHLPSALVAVDR